MKKDIKVEVTKQIIAKLEGAVDGKFEMPFKSFASGQPHNVKSGKAYRGINVMITMMAGFASPVWGTYKQWQERGAQVRGGETATTIVFWKPIERRDKDTGEKTRFMLARAYNVFNAEQVDGYEQPAPVVLVDEVEASAIADEFFAAQGVTEKTAAGRAFYSPAGNYVSLPARDHFHATSTSSVTDAYYSTKAHEYTHATSHPSRLDRELGSRFGDEGYAFEELVAELGAAMTMNHLGLNATVRDDHAKYIKSWIKVLKDDTNAIFSAASKAQAALDWMVEQQPIEIEEAA